MGWVALVSASSRGFRFACLVGAAVGLGVAVSGCASKGTPYNSGTSSASASGAAAAPTVSVTPLPSMSAVAAASGQLTGDQLVQVLLPASFFPAGFAASSAPVTSGGSLTSGAASFNLAATDCATLVYHLGRNGFGETALAASSSVGTGQVYDQVVYQFPSAAAATGFVAGVRSVAARCAKPFTANEGTASGTFTLSVSDGVPVGGHSSVNLSQTGKLGGSSLVLNTLLVPSGVDVFLAAAVGIGGGAPAVPARETIAYSLMKRQAAAALLG
jgi:hypothetical protein